MIDNAQEFDSVVLNMGNDQIKAVIKGYKLYFMPVAAE